METLKSVAIGWLMLVMIVQSAVFIWTPNNGMPLWKNYLASWAKSLALLAKFFVPAKSAEERKELLIVWLVLFLCLPGAVLVLHVFGRMAA